MENVSLWSVSYTHLDVYKRQDYIRRPRLSRSALRLRDEGCRITDVAFELGLDVYKRQGHRFRTSATLTPSRVKVVYLSYSQSVGALRLTRAFSPAPPSGCMTGREMTRRVQPEVSTEGDSLFGDEREDAGAEEAPPAVDNAPEDRCV